MKYAYSPDTLEFIPIAEPADWMGTTDVAPPVYDRDTAGCFWRGTSWEIVQSELPDTKGPRIAAIDAEILALESKSHRPVRDALAALATQAPVDPTDALKITEISTRIAELRVERKGLTA